MKTARRATAGVPGYIGHCDRHDKRLFDCRRLARRHVNDGSGKGSHMTAYRCDSHPFGWHVGHQTVEVRTGQLRRIGTPIPERVTVEVVPEVALVVTFDDPRDGALLVAALLDAAGASQVPNRDAARYERLANVLGDALDACPDIPAWAAP